MGNAAGHWNLAARRSESATAPTRHVQVGQVRLAYRRLGRPSAVPLVLLQRFRGTMDDWDPLFLDILAARRELLLFDSAGIGHSGGDVPPSIPGMARVAAGFLEALGVAQADVLGWSMGGCVAQWLALEHPGLVRRLVLAATSPGGVRDAPRVADRVLETMLKPANSDDDFLYLFFPHTAQGRLDGFNHLRRLGQRGSGQAPAVRPEGIQAQLAALRAFGSGDDAALPRLGRLTQPALVANGQADVMVPAYNSFVMAQRLPNAHLVLYPHAGHAFHFQRPPDFTGRVEAFLE